MKHFYKRALSLGLLWCLIFTAMPSMAQVLDFTPFPVARGTGSTNDTVITQTSMIHGENDEDGWMVFDISGFQSVPSNYLIDSIVFRFEVDSTNWPWWSLCPMRFDPFTAPADSLKVDIEEDESNANTRYAHFQESSSFAPGYYSRNITSPNLINDFSAAVSSGVFPIGVGSTDNSSTYYIRIQGWNETTPPSLFVYYTVVSCALPSNLTALNVTSNSVDLSWIVGDTNTALDWSIEFDTVGFTPGTGNSALATTIPFTLSGLTDGTEYDIYVYENCAGGSSPAVGPVSIKTLCNTIMAPFTEDFETGGSDPCVLQDANDDFDWTVRMGDTPSSGTGPDSANQGAYYVYTETSSPVDSGDVAILNFPPLDFSAIPNPGIQFDYHMYGASMGTLSWEVMDTVSSNWISVWSMSGDQGNQWFDDQQVSIASYASSTTLIRLRMEVGGPTAYENDVAVDDIQFLDVPSCLTPSSLSLVEATDVSVELSFMAGTGTSHNVEYGMPGYTPGTGTIVNVSTTNPIITGLTPGMEYDFYIQDDCGVDGTSDWTGPLTVKTRSCAIPCIFIIEMTDSWGDGWNGAFLDINVAGAEYQIGLTGLDTLGYDTIPFCGGDSITITYSSGSFDNEVGYTIYDADSNIMVAVTTGSASAGQVYQSTGVCDKCEDPIAGFSATLNSSGSAGHDYKFTDTSMSMNPPVTYSWDFGDGNTSTLQSPSHLFASNGTFEVMLIVTDSCGADTAVQQIVVQGIGFQEELEQSLTMFPNPTSGNLNISFVSQEKADYTIRISNAMGAEVMSVNRNALIGQQDLQLDLTQLPRGMYLVQLINEQGYVTRRISLQ